MRARFAILRRELSNFCHPERAEGISPILDKMSADVSFALIWRSRLAGSVVRRTPDIECAAIRDMLHRVVRSVGCYSMSKVGDRVMPGAR